MGRSRATVGLASVAEGAKDADRGLTKVSGFERLYGRLSKKIALDFK
jgi:hypothetical protein